MRLLERCDALRKPARFAGVLQACEADMRGRKGFEAAAYPQAQRLAAALEAAAAVDAGAIARACGDAVDQIRDRIHAARVAAVAARIGG
ncbi:Multifunctional CCA protein [compost metagenome]